MARIVAVSLLLVAMLLGTAKDQALAGHYHSVHWKDSATPTVLDYTPNNSTWDNPMYNAVWEWNNRSGAVNMGWADQLQNDYACDGLPGYRYISICKTRYDAPWCGYWWYGLESDGTGYHIYSARIQIDAWCATTQSGRHEIACHELGHALGLGHRAELSTCMNGDPFNDAATSNFPDSHDIFELDSIVYAYPEGTSNHYFTSHVGSGSGGGCKGAGGVLFSFPYSIFDVFTAQSEGLETEAYVPGMGYTYVPLPWSHGDFKPERPVKDGMAPTLNC